jgi:hypothetical protein
MSRRFAANVTAHRNRGFDNVLGEIAPSAFRFPIPDLAASASSQLSLVVKD